MKIEGLSDKGYKLPETKNKDDHRRYEIRLKIFKIFLENNF